MSGRWLPLIGAALVVAGVAAVLEGNAPFHVDAVLLKGIEK